MSFRHVRLELIVRSLAVSFFTMSDDYDMEVLEVNIGQEDLIIDTEPTDTPRFVRFTDQATAVENSPTLYGKDGSDPAEVYHPEPEEQRIVRHLTRRQLVRRQTKAKKLMYNVPDKSEARITARRVARQRQRQTRKANDNEIRQIYEMPTLSLGEGERELPADSIFGPAPLPADYWEEIRKEYENVGFDPNPGEINPFHFMNTHDPPTHPGEKPVWKILRSLEISAMNLARKTSWSRELVPMPKLPLDKLWEMVDKLKVINWPTQSVLEYRSDVHHNVRMTERRAEQFIKVITKYHFFSFDVVANGTLEFNKGGKKGETGRSILVVAHPEAEVLIYYDPDDVPDNLRKVFADPTVFKIQTGIDRDVGLLPFRVFGLIDAGTFVPFFDNSCRQYSARVLYEHVWRDDNWVKWDHYGFPRIYERETLHCKHKSFLNKNLALVHTLQEVFTPMAAVLIIATYRHLPDWDRFPLVNDILELCWAKCPQALTNQRLTKPQMWTSDEAPISKPDRYNSQPEVQRVRQARQHFYEPRMYSLEEAEKDAKDRCVNGLPKGEDVYVRDSRVRMWKLCQNCGSASHQTEGCEKYRFACNYSHFGIA